MDQDSKQHFLVAGAFRAAAQEGSELSFVHGEGTLHVDTLMVDLSPEPPFHLAAVLGRGPLTRSSGVDGDDAGTNSQDFPAETMVPLPVVGGVGEDPIPLDQVRGLSQGRRKARRIVAGTIADMAPDPEVRACVAKNRQLRPERAAEALGLVLGLLLR